jgi:hypothetical protein
MTNTTQSDNNQRIRLVVILILLATVALIPFEILLDESHPVCIHLYLFGFQCPLCGMTRAVHQFTRLEFASAIHYNAVVVLLPIYFAADIATCIFPKKGLELIRKIVIVLIGVGLVMLYAVRILRYLNWI